MCLNRVPLEELTMESQIYATQLHKLIGVDMKSVRQDKILSTSRFINCIYKRVK